MNRPWEKRQQVEETDHRGERGLGLVCGRPDGRAGPAAAPTSRHSLSSTVWTSKNCILKLFFFQMFD